MDVYWVFELLDNYYDDNDRVLFTIVDSEEKAKKVIEKYSMYNLTYSIRTVN